MRKETTTVTTTRMHGTYTRALFNDDGSLRHLSISNPDSMGTSLSYYDKGQLSVLAEELRAILKECS